MSRGDDVDVRIGPHRIRRAKVTCSRCGRRLGGIPVPTPMPAWWTDPFEELHVHDWMVRDGVMRQGFYGPALRVENVAEFTFEAQSRCRCGSTAATRLHTLLGALRDNGVTL